MNEAMTAPGTHRFALPALVAGAIGIAFSPIFVRLSELGPTATAFHRAFLALPLLWAWLLIADARPAAARAPARLTRREAWLLLAAGVSFTGDLAVWHWSLQFTTVANATLLSNLTPIFVTFVAWAWFKERITPRFLLGLALAMVGVLVMVRASFFVGTRQVWGDLLGISTATFYAAYLISIKLLRATLSTLRIMAWSTAICAVCLLPLALLFGEPIVAATAAGWLVLFGIAWVSQVGGQGSIAYALAHLPASFSSVALLVQPATAALLAWVILGEGMSPLQAAGGVVVLAGILLARRASQAQG
jgi:drug/metabolite transporter (DMT)-like permease